MQFFMTNFTEAKNSDSINLPIDHLRPKDPPHNNIIHH